MSDALKRKIVIVVVFIAMLLISIDAIVKKPVSVGATRTVNTTFVRSEEHPQKGGSHYYIYTKDFICYELGRQATGCFNYDAFSREIKAGDSLKIRIETGPDSKLSLLPVELWANEKAYLTLDCMNKDINDNKKATPILCFVFFATTLIYFLYKKEKHAGK